MTRLEFDGTVDRALHRAKLSQAERDTLWRMVERMPAAPFLGACEALLAGFDWSYGARPKLTDIARMTSERIQPEHRTARHEPSDNLASQEAIHAVCMYVSGLLGCRTARQKYEAQKRLAPAVVACYPAQAQHHADLEERFRVKAEAESAAAPAATMQAVDDFTPHVNKHPDAVAREWFGSPSELKANAASPADSREMSLPCPTAPRGGGGGLMAAIVRATAPGASQAAKTEDVPF